MNKKKCVFIMQIFFIGILLVVFPYIAEKIILLIHGDSFNIKIMLPKEVWFGFISSYLGAIGTVILGGIAIWQNKKYKELSDNYSGEIMQIQKELKELNKRTVDAIETLEKIEVAIYSPVIQEIPYTFYGISKDALEEKNDICAYQRNCINTDPSDLFIPLDKFMDKYSIYGFAIGNIGEKTLRNFILLNSEMKINNETPSVIYSETTDIISGENVYILFANLPLITGDNYLELDFEFYTLLLDRYVFHVDLMITYDENSCYSTIFNFEEPHKVA